MIFITAFVSTAFSFAPFDVHKLQQRLEHTASIRQLRYASTPPQIPLKAYEKAAKGDVATGIQEQAKHEAKQGWGVAIFPMPIQQLWSGINDELKHTGLTPVSHTEILVGKPCAASRIILMILPIPLLSDRWWVVENRTNPQLQQRSQGLARELSWKELTPAKTTPLIKHTKQRLANKQRVPFTRGGWLLIALDEHHTLGEYYSWAVPGGSLPTGPVSTLAASGIKKTMTAMKNFSQEQGNLRCFQ